MNYVLVAEIRALQSNLTLEQIRDKESTLRSEVRHLEALFYQILSHGDSFSRNWDFV